MAALRLLFVTIPPERADAFVTQLVEEQLIACGNVLPAVRSHYVWNGALCHDEEAVLLMETAEDRVQAAMARIVELHPYECPKVVVLAPEAVHGAYLEWAVARTRPPG